MLTPCTMSTIWLGKQGRYLTCVWSWVRFPSPAISNQPTHATVWIHRLWLTLPWDCRTFSSPRSQVCPDCIINTISGASTRARIKCVYHENGSRRILLLYPSSTKTQSTWEDEGHWRWPNFKLWLYCTVLHTQVVSSKKTCYASPQRRHDTDLRKEVSQIPSSQISELSKHSRDIQ